jgi:hypothetical protein
MAVIIGAFHPGETDIIVAPDEARLPPLRSASLPERSERGKPPALSRQTPLISASGITEERRAMSRSNTLVLACSMLLLGATAAPAQTKVIPGEQVTVSATVEAVEPSSRMLTLKGPKGELRTVKVPEKVKRLSEIKVGDKITATYYDDITLRMKQPGEKDVDTLTEGVTRGTGARPAGAAATQQTITATIDAIDMKVPSISFKGPRGWSYSTRVRDKKALDQLKVGDRVDIFWTDVQLISVADAKE